MGRNRMFNNRRRFMRGEFGNCDKDKFRQRVLTWKNVLRQEDAKEPNHYVRKLKYLLHRKRILRMKPTPKVSLLDKRVDRASIVHEIDFHRRLQNVADVEIANAKLLVRLKKVYAEDRKKNFVLDHKKIFILQDRTFERVLNFFHLGKQNIEIQARLRKIKSLVQTRQELKEWYEKMEEKMQILSEFPLYWKKPTKYDLIQKPEKGASNPIVYLDFEVETNSTKQIGRIFIELYRDIVPITVENFRQLCLSEKYVGLKLSHILPKLLWQGGEGIDSFYGGTFPDENYEVKHDSPGIISMVNFGKGKNKSEFRIMGIPYTKFNSKSVGFGKVIIGMRFLHQLSKFSEPSELGVSRNPVIIIGSGETTLETMDSLPPVKSIYVQNLEYKLKSKKQNKDMDQKYKNKNTKSTKFSFIKTPVPTTGSVTEKESRQSIRTKEKKGNIDDDNRSTASSNSSGSESSEIESSS